MTTDWRDESCAVDQCQKWWIPIFHRIISGTFPSTAAGTIHVARVQHTSAVGEFKKIAVCGNPVIFYLFLFFPQTCRRFTRKSTIPTFPDLFPTRTRHVVGPSSSVWRGPCGEFDETTYVHERRAYNVTEWRGGEKSSGFIGTTQKTYARIRNINTQIERRYKTSFFLFPRNYMHVSRERYIWVFYMYNLYGAV